MVFGVCSGPEDAGVLAEAGFDYIELHVQLHLRPEEPEKVFKEYLDQIQSSPLPCSAANCFIPGHLKITGPAVDSSLLEQYVSTACKRAERAGINTIAFGSGGARQVPDGFNHEDAVEQLVSFARMAGDIAWHHSITICVEPLNRSECNILNTVSEAADFVRTVGHDHVKLLVDAYHWARNGEPAESIPAAAQLIHHVHVATYGNRMAPGLEYCDFSDFFSALARAGYDGRVSIEGAWTSMAEDAGKALNTLRSLRACTPGL
jgi:sugar phosphate isomerase/epimerase